MQVPDDVADRLMRAATARGTSTEEVAADVLTSFVEDRRPLSFAGTLHSGRADLAERIEEILGSEPSQ